MMQGDMPPGAAARHVASGTGLEKVIIDGTEFVQVSLNGKIVLASAKCPHRGAPMAEASILGQFIVCVRHGATFDLRTGARVRGPECKNIEIRPVEEISKT